ncbi:hypothetical protein AJ79_01328 [Helicocarpus griseus UAMH5409]|uniref:Uncharacterized protein n=1 Tax=Helicocarpus griseus UAMH5409 TaxID=1447875 RepID=A0A2B7Y7K6_9EURO|nr:hypothetical protein AJ79_01328 [Helicocarpus griseus UAMH5409]
MADTYTSSPTTTQRPRHYATYPAGNPSKEDEIKNNNADRLDKQNKKERKRSLFALLGKLSSSRSSSRSPSPFPSPPPLCSSPSTPPQLDSTEARRASHPLTPPTSTSLVSINLKPAEYVQRIKSLLANSRKAPPSPLTSSSHHSAPNNVDHVEANRNRQYRDNVADGDGEPHRRSQMIPIKRMIPTSPVLSESKIYNNDSTGRNTAKPAQDQTRTPSPLLPPAPQTTLLTPLKESKFCTFLRSPPRSNTPLTQYNIDSLQAELAGKPEAARGAIDVSKPNPLGADGDDDYDELLELGRSARGLGRDEEFSRSREKLVNGVEKWLNGVQEGAGLEN